jgi:DNA (cytosine-5)-methyltransferase 1
MAVGLAIRSALRGTVFDYETLMHPDAVHEEEEHARQLSWTPPLVPNLDVDTRAAVAEPA